MIKRTLAIGLLGLYGAAVIAAPAPVTDVTSGSSDKRLAELEQKFQSRTEAQHRQQEQLDILQTEVNELRGVIEVQNYQLEKILERQRELYLEIDKRIEAVNSQPITPSIVTTTTTAAVEVPMTANENEAYDKAVNLILKDRLYDQAIPEFQAFLENFPDSSYVSNAHYWLGQLLFNKNELVEAKKEFEVVVSQFLDSSKRSDAMLKLATVEQKQNNKARAVNLYQQLIKEYPNSSAAKLAQPRLTSLL